MKKRFWFKLSAILLISILSLFFCFSWVFSVHQSRHFNHYNQSYLAEHFLIIYKDIQTYLKVSGFHSSHLKRSLSKRKDNKPTLGEWQDVLSLNNKEITFFLTDKSGRILLHTESHYRNKKLPSSSSFLSLMKQNPKGWNRVISENGQASSVITVARPINLNSDKKYFLIASQPMQRPGLVFLSHLKKTVLFSIVAFTVLFLFIFFYLRSFISAADFLFCLFGAGGSLVRWNNFLSSTVSSSLSKNRMEQNKALSYLAHTNNTYLKSMREALTAVLRFSKNKDQGGISPIKPTFLTVVNRVIDKSCSIYSHLKINRDLASDIELPVFSDQLFQSLWELIKNAAQALPSGQDGALTIRTFKKNDKWFCCEVEDEGPGMDKQIIERAAQLYFTTKKYSTGLGLPFVQSVLSRMGGIVKLQSSEGGGLTVCLFIPLDYITYVQSFTPDRHQNKPLQMFSSLGEEKELIGIDETEWYKKPLKENDIECR